jgi:hypothetical protein
VDGDSTGRDDVDELRRRVRQALEEAQEAAGALHTARGLEPQVRAAERALGVETDVRRTAQRRLAETEAGPRVLWWRLRGQLAEEREVRRGSLQRAEESEARAEAALQSLRAHLQRARDRARAGAMARNGLAGLTARLRDELAASGLPASVVALEAEIAAAQARRSPLVELRSTLDAALTEIERAERQFGSAKSWGTYDTWLGGGVLASLEKSDRVHAAQQTVDAARRALSRVRDATGALALPETGDMRWTSDIWWDGFSRDMDNQRKITQAMEQTRAAGVHLRSVRSRVDRELADLDRTIGRLEDDVRRELLRA